MCFENFLAVLLGASCCCNSGNNWNFCRNSNGSSCCWNSSGNGSCCNNGRSSCCWNSSSNGSCCNNGQSSCGCGCGCGCGRSKSIPVVFSGELTVPCGTSFNGGGSGFSAGDAYYARQYGLNRDSCCNR